MTMGKPALDLKADAPLGIEGGAVLNALTTAVVVVDADDVIRFLNGAGEQLLGGSIAYLGGQRLDELLPADSPLFALIAQARGADSAVLEHNVNISSPRIGMHSVNVEAMPLAEARGWVVVALHPLTIAEALGHQSRTHRGAARSVSAMAAMLAHEVKNPLSGIRGAAQLLEQTLPPEERGLTRLICEETDRICGLVDRMEAFSDRGPVTREPVNIHEVLDRVERVARSGFARHVRFIKAYDPSLPAVPASRDQLIQVFLNLVKNAAEATPRRGAEVTLRTAYRRGVRIAAPGRRSRVHLPLVVAVEDNGEGIPDDIRPYLFDPFLTTKAKGSGLGLALVAKIVDDHGGAIEFDCGVGGTVFRVLLPVETADEAV